MSDIAPFQSYQNANDQSSASVLSNAAPSRLPLRPIQPAAQVSRFAKADGSKLYVRPDLYSPQKRTMAPNPKNYQQHCSDSLYPVNGDECSPLHKQENDSFLIEQSPNQQGQSFDHKGAHSLKLQSSNKYGGSIQFSTPRASRIGAKSTQKPLKESGNTVIRSLGFSQSKGLCTAPHFELEGNPSFWDEHNVQVLIRARPLNNAEVTMQGGNRCIKQDSAHTLTWTGQPEARFTFDHIASETITQAKLFNVVGLPMVENCMSGYNSCMFAYGQTGSGKTHTMLGDISGEEPNEERGMIPRVFEYLFSRIQMEQVARKHEGLEYKCSCSFLEIYNEQITDLLDPSSTNLQLREDVKKGVHVENLTEVQVTTVEDVMQVLLKGACNRKVAFTNMNKESSRSHSVFTCVIESKWENGSIINTRFGHLNLVDLAGSERQRSSGAEGDRLKEAANINKSLLTLGQVIMALVDIANGKQRHVPYRDSKLTFLLQDSLGGNSKTTIIANVSPSHCCALETLSTLKFAQRAKFIRNNATINEDTLVDVAALHQQIQQLKDEVKSLRHQDMAKLTSNKDANHLEHASVTSLLGRFLNDNPSCETKTVGSLVVESLKREQAADNKLKELAKEIEHLNSLVRQREEDTQCGKMMLRFREDKIKRMESLVDGLICAETYLFEEKNSLVAELEILRSQSNHNPELTRFAMENIRLRSELQRFQDFYDCGERKVMLQDISNLRDQLLKLLQQQALNDCQRQTLLAKQETIQVKVNEYQQEIEELRTSLGSVKVENDQYLRQIDELQTKLATAYGHHNELHLCKADRGILDSKSCTEGQSEFLMDELELYCVTPQIDQKHNPVEALQKKLQQAFEFAREAEDKTKFLNNSIVAIYQSKQNKWETEQEQLKEQIRATSLILQEKEDQISALQNEFAYFHQQVANKDEEKQLLTALQRDNQKLALHIRHLEKILIEKEAEVLFHHLKEDAVEVAIGKYHSEVQCLNEKMQDQDIALIGARAEIDCLEMQKHSILVDIYSQLQVQDTQDFTMDLEILDHELILEELRTLLDALKKKDKQLTRQLDNLRNESVEEKEQLKEQIRVMASLLEERERLIYALQHDLTYVHQQMTESEEEKQKLLYELQSNNEKSASHVNHLEQFLVQKETDILFNQLSKDALEMAVEEYHTKVQSLYEEIRNKDAALAGARSEINQRSSILMEILSQLQKIQSKLTGRDDFFLELEVLDHERILMELQESLDNLVIKKNLLSRQLDELNSAWEAEREQLKEQIRATSSLLEDRENQISALQHNLVYAHQQLTEEEGKRELLSAQLQSDTVKSALHTKHLEQFLVENEAEVLSYQLSKDALKMALEEYHKKVQSLNVEIQNKDTALVGVRAEINQKTSILMEILSQLQKIQSKLTGRDDIPELKVHDYERILVELQNSLNGLTIKEDFLSRQLGVLNNEWGAEKEQLKEQIRVASLLVEERENQISALQHNLVYAHQQITEQEGQRELLYARLQSDNVKSALHTKHLEQFLVKNETEVLSYQLRNDALEMVLEEYHKKVGRLNAEIQNKDAALLGVRTEINQRSSILMEILLQLQKIQFKLTGRDDFPELKVHDYERILVELQNSMDDLVIKKELLSRQLIVVNNEWGAENEQLNEQIRATSLLLEERENQISALQHNLVCAHQQITEEEGKRELLYTRLQSDNANSALHIKQLEQIVVEREAEVLLYQIKQDALETALDTYHEKLQRLNDERRNNHDALVGARAEIGCLQNQKHLMLAEIVSQLQVAQVQLGGRNGFLAVDEFESLLAEVRSALNDIIKSNVELSRQLEVLQLETNNLWSRNEKQLHDIEMLEAELDKKRNELEVLEDLNKILLAQSMQIQDDLNQWNLKLKKLISPDDLEYASSNFDLHELPSASFALIQGALEAHKQGIVDVDASKWSDTYKKLDGDGSKLPNAWFLLKMSLHVLWENVDSLVSQNTDLRQVAEELKLKSDLEKKVASLESELAAKTTQFESVQSASSLKGTEILNLNAIIDSLMQDIERLKSKNSHLVDDISSKYEAITIIHIELDLKMAEIEKMQIFIEKLKEKHAQSLHALSVMQIADKQNMVSLNADSIKFKRKIEDMQLENASLKESLVDKDNLIDSLEERLFELASFLEENIKEAAEELCLVERRKDELHVELVVTNEQLEMAQAVIEEHKMLVAEHCKAAKNSEIEADRKERMIKCLERTVEELESIVNALENQVGKAKEEAEMHRLLKEDLEREVNRLTNLQIQRHRDERRESMSEAELRQMIQLVDYVNELEKEVSEKDEEIQSLELRIRRRI